MKKQHKIGTRMVVSVKKVHVFGRELLYVTFDAQDPDCDETNTAHVIGTMADLKANTIAVIEKTRRTVQSFPVWKLVKEEGN